MRTVISVAPLLLLARAWQTQNRTEEEQGRRERVLSVFNVVTFPNSPCSAASGWDDLDLGYVFVTLKKARINNSLH